MKPFRPFASMVVIAAVLRFAASASAQTTPNLSYVVTQWGMEQGLPQSSVNDILQSKDGYIWLATFGGLVRFDGVAFTTYNRFNTACMSSDRILRLFEDRDGVLWVSTEDGLLEFKSDSCNMYDLDRIVISPTAIVVNQDGFGNIWVVASNRIYMNDGNGFELMEPETNNPTDMEAAVADTNGLWLGFSELLLRTGNRRIFMVRSLSTIIDQNIVDVVEFPNRSGTLFIATSGNGIFRYRNGEVDAVAVSKREHSRFIWRLYVDQSRKLWALNFNGLELFDGTSFKEFNPLEQRPDDAFLSIFHDNEDNLWLGSNSSGLFQLHRAIFTMIDQRQGLKTEQMLSLTRTPEGRFLFATNCGGVYEWKDGKATLIPINRYLPNQCVWSIFADTKGRYWFGSREVYMSTSLDKPGIIPIMDSGDPILDVNAITEDRDGTLWFGSLRGVVTYDGARFTTFTTADGLSFNDVRSFHQDREGRMWVGTVRGLSVIFEGRVRKILLADGPRTSTEPYVRAIHEDVDGVIWIGTYGNGIYRWDNGQVTNIRKEHGLYDNIVSHLVEDENGDFWAGSNSGVFRTSRAMLNAFHSGSIPRVTSQFYGVRNGMNSAETNGGFQPSVIYDDDGNLYFPTMMGVAMVSTRKAAKQIAIPPVYITSIRAHEKEFVLGATIELPYNTPYLEIVYTALYYRDASKLRFRYRIMGLQDDWIEVDTRRSAFFTRLPPGDYVFTVSASVDGNLWNETGASVAIRVVPPFWGTVWFKVLVGIAFLITGPAIFLSRVNTFKAEQEKNRRFTEQLIDSQENERRRIAAELHDGLGQQILVIKNRAEIAQGTLSDPAQIMHHLQEIMHSALSSISDVRTITHNLRPVHLERFGLTDSLQSLFEDLRQTSSIEWSFQIDNIDEMIRDTSQIHFYRVIQEGTTNIQKHSRAEHASVFIQSGDFGIRALVWDDGVGLDVAQKHPKGGLGLSGMQERMQGLGGTFRIVSNPDEGTSLTLTLPNPKTLV